MHLLVRGGRWTDTLSFSLGQPSWHTWVGGMAAGQELAARTGTFFGTMTSCWDTAYPAAYLDSFSPLPSLVCRAIDLIEPDIFSLSNNEET